MEAYKDQLSRRLAEKEEAIVRLDEQHVPFDEEPLPVPVIKPKRFGKKHREAAAFAGRGR